MKESDRPLPIRALLAFEAAARLGSFTRAAGELYMTQAAISYQVKQLERSLGVSLFKRAGRHVHLTAAGQRLSTVTSEAFGLLRATCANLTEHKHSRVGITALPTVASNWLVPRLGDFHAKYPEYAVQLNASVEAADMRVSDFDIAIRTGGGNWPGCEALRLFQSRYTVVCEPGLILSNKIGRPEDLLDVPLFGRRNMWVKWLDAAGVPNDRHSDVRVTDLGMEQSEVTAALAQYGAAIVTSAFFQQDFASNRICAPFATELTQEDPYWLVYRAGEKDRPNVRDFTQWICEQVT